MNSTESHVNNVFLKACRREKTDYTPIWIMRQAGRYLPEYRELRSKYSFLEMCKSPELAAEVTLMPLDRIGVDAAIIFADILLILEPMGIVLDFEEGRGPVLEYSIRGTDDIDHLLELESPEPLSYVYDAIKLVKRELKPEVALIGFCGAPFTVASYIIEGGSSRNFQKTKTLMYRDFGTWHALMDKLGRALAKYVGGQIDAGAQAIQLFDSWVGCLGEADFREFVFPHLRRLVEAIKGKVPLIYFGANSGQLLNVVRELDVNVIGLDWRTNLAEAWQTVGYEKAVQGNLDPAALFAEPTEIRHRARVILDQAAGRPGHIFNLGHGILPDTPVEHAAALVDAVHEYRSS